MPGHLTLRPVDLIILMGLMAGLTMVGLLFTRRRDTTKDYFLGGKNLPWWAVALSIVATETSAATFVAVPAWSYAPSGGNLFFLQLTLGYLIGRLLIALWFVPKLRERDSLSIYEYLEHRFGPKARAIAGATYFVTRALASGVRLYIPAMVLNKIAPEMGIGTCIFVSMAATLLYTVFGGFKAVIWTDVLMFVIYVAGGVACLVRINMLSDGGFSGLMAVASDAQKLKWLNLDVLNFKVNYTLLSGLVGGAVLTLATHGTDQSIGQRLLACRTSRDSQWAIATSGLIIIPQFILFLFIGVMLYGFFHANLPPVQDNDIMAYFIVNHLPYLLADLIIAGIFAAALSTTSAEINALANVTMTDFYKRFLRPGGSDSHYLWVGRLFSLGWGLVLMVVAYLPLYAKDFPLLDLCLAIPSLTFGALLGAYLLGFFTRRTTERGVITGAVAGLMATLWWGFFPMLYRFFPDPMPEFMGHITKLGWPWFCPIGAGTTVMVGYWASYLPWVGEARQNNK
ncbi:MAG: sodium:solute symporter [bacterium]